MTSSSETGEAGPQEILVRAYQVGFGDCFLLTFRYERREDDRHILIDFGSTEVPEGAPKRSEMLRQIAQDIEKRCDRHLHAVVATHRHADHINGFSTTDDQTGSGDIIRRCRPDLVLQPWTEDPDAPRDPRAKPLLDRLAMLHAMASRIETTELKRLYKIKGYSPKVLNELRLFAANNAGDHEVANRRAVANLRAMGNQCLYLSYGQASQLRLPGVKVHVLGPPTLEQWPQIQQQRANDPNEFWQLLQSANPVTGSLGPLFDGPATRVSEWAPQYARWLIRRLSSLRGEQLLEMVRILDDVLNNTSLILLFEAGDQKLLFPGDAQLENWSYALSRPGAEELLRGATLYKVGHHGSRNATPKSLWKLIGQEGLRSVVSTKPDKHGSSDSHTEVPRATLIKELRKFELVSTQDMGWSLTADGEPPSRELTFHPA
jgi:hypothetical protein